jgi:hypothetical protein
VKVALLMLVCFVGGSGTAEEPTEIAARVVLEAPHDAGRSDWVEFHVEGGGVPSIERCERLVEAELHHVYPAGASIKPRVQRPCYAATLPAMGRPSVDAQILRVREPLPALDLFSITSTPTVGYVVRYTRTFSAVECEHRREQLTASARGEVAASQKRKALEEEARLNGEQIAKMCDRKVRKRSLNSPGSDSYDVKKRGRDAWLEHDLARSRCEQAKRMGEILAGKRAEAAQLVDQAERTCVRE